MSDNLRRYRAIRDALTQCYPGQPSRHGRQALDHPGGAHQRHRGQQEHPAAHIATKVPNGTKPESRVKRFARWLDNAHILEEVYFLPYADVLLRHLALETVVLVMDGSGVGRGCLALMIHVVYKPMVLVSYKLHNKYRTIKTNSTRFWACSRQTTPPRWSV